MINVFDQVDFDTAMEYNKTTGGFTSAHAGIYAFNCTIEFDQAVSTDWYVTIRKNGTDFLGGEINTPATNGLSLSFSGLAQLAVGDTVTCAAYQTSGSSLPIYVGSGSSRNSFSGARLN
jgi:hypothetical protein